MFYTHLIYLKINNTNLKKLFVIKYKKYLSDLSDILYKNYNLSVTLIK